MKIVVSCAFFLGSMCAVATTNLVTELNMVLGAIRQDYEQNGHGRYPRSISILEDWRDTGISSNQHFNVLRGVVGNQWRDAWISLNSITNKDDRLMIIAAGAANNEADFLARIDFLADLVLSNRVSSVELTYFENRCADISHFAASALVRRYNEPAISNLILNSEG